MDFSKFSFSNIYKISGLKSLENVPSLCLVVRLFGFFFSDVMH